MRVQLNRGFKVVQIDFPATLNAPEGRKPGSVHFGRNRLVEVTTDEMEWLKANRPEVHQCLDLVPEPNLPGRAARQFANAAQAAKQAAAPKVEPKKRGKKGE